MLRPEVPSEGGSRNGESGGGRGGSKRRGRCPIHELRVARSHDNFCSARIAFCCLRLARCNTIGSCGRRGRARSRASGGHRNARYLHSCGTRQRRTTGDRRNRARHSGEPNATHGVTQGARQRKQGEAGTEDIGAQGEARSPSAGLAGAAPATSLCRRGSRGEN